MNVLEVLGLIWVITGGLVVLAAVWFVLRDGVRALRGWRHRRIVDRFLDDVQRGQHAGGRRF
jgi:prophage antirepressor-like protein